MTDTKFEGRLFDPRETLKQLNPLTFMGISGGRWNVTGMHENGVEALHLPVSNGYSVVITLAADDTYTVQRQFKRGGKTWVKGTLAGVYFDRLSEAAYYASCFRSYDEHQWVTKA